MNDLDLIFTSELCGREMTCRLFPWDLSQPRGLCRSPSPLATPSSLWIVSAHQ